MASPADAAPVTPKRSVSLQAADSRWRFAGSRQQGSFESPLWARRAYFVDFPAGVRQMFCYYEEDPEKERK